MQISRWIFLQGEISVKVTQGRPPFPNVGTVQRSEVRTDPSGTMKSFTQQMKMIDVMLCRWATDRMDEWIEDGAFLGEDFFGKGGGKESEIGGHDHLWKSVMIHRNLDTFSCKENMGSKAKNL